MLPIFPFPNIIKASRSGKNAEEVSWGRESKERMCTSLVLLKIATHNYNNTLLCDYGTYTVSLGLLHQQNGTSLYFIFPSGDVT